MQLKNVILVNHNNKNRFKLIFKTNLNKIFETLLFTFLFTCFLFPKMPLGLEGNIHIQKNLGKNPKHGFFRASTI